MALLTAALMLAPGTGLARQPDEPLPDAGDVVDAFAVARRWLDEFELPPPKDPDARHAVRQAGGVCLVLRRSGQVIGVGTDATGDELMLRRAAGRAFNQVLADQSVSALPPALRDGVGRMLTLELEVAGPPQPVLGRTFDAVERRLEPGLDALAMRRGQDWAMLLPSQVRATTRLVAVARLARTLAVELGLPPADLPTLLEEHDVALYRASTIHLAQPDPGASPIQTVRGQRLVPELAVTRRSIATLADDIARHVIRSLYQGPPERTDVPIRFRGDYEPTDDEHDPLLATPMEQALLCFALGRYVRAPAVDPGTAQNASRIATDVLLDLATSEAGEADPLDDLGSSAAVLLAVAEVPDARAVPACRTMADKARDRLIAALTTPPGDDDAPTLSAQMLVLAAAALARDLRDQQPVHPALVRDALEQAWSTAPGLEALSLLPWVVWAEVDSARATGAELPQPQRLLALRDALNQLRIGSGALRGPADLHGGFVLSGRSLASSRGLRATAQSLRPAAALATMVRTPSLTAPGQTSAELGRHLKTVRFLMQLSV
ncbi:MAG: hypothetical protein ACYTGC_13775, partial [Planctomycetota bacterium]